MRQSSWNFNPFRQFPSRSYSSWSAASAMTISSPSAATITSFPFALDSFVDVHQLADRIRILEEGPLARQSCLD